MIPRTFKDIVEFSFALYDEPSAGKFSDFAYTNIIDAALYKGYIDICTESGCHPDWFELTLTPGQFEYDYPEGCKVVKLVRWKSNHGIKLARTYPNHIECMVYGTPELYYTTPKKIGIWRIPNQSFVLDIYGYRGPEKPITDRNEEPDLIPLEYRPVLAYYLCQEYARIDKNAAKVDPNLFPKWVGTYQAALDEMKRALNEGRNEDEYVGVM